MTALEGIDLEIGRGEFVSLIGPSGCGKSTLLRIIGDLIAPTAGSVEVNGKPAEGARRDRDYGMVFQAPVLFDWRTVEDNVKLPLEVQGMDGRQRQEMASRMLELVELKDFLRHYPWQLSGGMQQRVAIARALALEPSILLMDEPFGALDEMTRERMNSEVQRIWQQTGTTVVFVTHSIPEAVFLSSRVVVMSARPGRITRIVDVDLPRPRDDETRESERYFELVTEVREALRQRDDDVAGAIGSDAPDPRGGRRRVSTSVGTLEPGSAGSAGSAAERLRGVGQYLPAVAVFFGGIALWEGIVAALDLRAFILPRPSAIVAALTDNWADGRYALLPSFQATLFEAVGGLVIGTVAGVVAAFGTARWATAREHAPADRDRRERDPDHRLRAAHEQLVRGAQSAVEDDDGGGPGVLPGHGQRDPRPRRRSSPRRSS